VESAPVHRRAGDGPTVVGGRAGPGGARPGRATSRRHPGRALVIVANVTPVPCRPQWRHARTDRSLRS
jgi:hypothetical protein